MVSSYLGETATNLREIFEVASKNPCLLFLDECDSLAKPRADIATAKAVKTLRQQELIIDKQALTRY
jgi:ATP-dependent 26S proteasome regulatory subunit